MCVIARVNHHRLLVCTFLRAKVSLTHLEDRALLASKPSARLGDRADGVGLHSCSPTNPLPRSGSQGRGSGLGRGVPGNIRQSSFKEVADHFQSRTLRYVEIHPFRCATRYRVWLEV